MCLEQKKFQKKIPEKIFVTIRLRITEVYFQAVNSCHFEKC